MNKSKLDQTTLDIEFLLISVVQGVALAALGAAASEPLASLKWQYFPYIAAGFLLILTFWSQAIVHSLSFIDWPLDLGHNFLYFLASFVEVLAFSHISDPLRWFAFLAVFSMVAAVLYFVDLGLIKERKKDFQTSEARRVLYKHILGEQEKEMKTIVPAGLIFNALGFYSIYQFPEVFINQGYHLVLVLCQVLVTGWVIMVSIKSFRKRSKLISECI